MRNRRHQYLTKGKKAGFCALSPSKDRDGGGGGVLPPFGAEGKKRGALRAEACGFRNYLFFRGNPAVSSGFTEDFGQKFGWPGGGIDL